MSVALRSALFADVVIVRISRGAGAGPKKVEKQETVVSPH